MINTHQFREGLRDGIPIASGYFAVAFSLGIAARNAGLTPLQGFLASLLNNASAGEYIGFTMIAAGASLAEIALLTIIANARYLLMSCALSQKLAPDTPLRHRILLGFDLTDELFGISIARKGFLNPVYTYGAMCVAIPGWSIGTYCGIVAGNVLPVRIVSALSVALYGMFLAIIIPPAKSNRILAACIAFSFAASFAAARLPLFTSISSGTMTILLTIAIAGAAALLFPIDSRPRPDKTEENPS
ncbi:MAG: AzlC family ABC transporter permease [Desulfovibrionaceae bacterium]|nr:AzlC family ABC transporter permease [Desulfovibrionaceae bacterium]